MKRLYILVFMILTMLSTYQTKNQDVFYNYFLPIANNFCYITSSTKENVALNSKFVKCGDYLFLNFSKKEKEINNVYYKQAEIADKNLLNKILKDLNIQIVVQKNEIYPVIYGFSPKFDKNVMICGKKVNFQVVIKDVLLVGTPMVYTGY